MKARKCRMSAKTETSFLTHDLDLAATLLTCGLRLLDVTRSNGGGRAQFEFEDVDQCEAVRRRFVCGELEANAFDLLGNLRGLKYRLHQI